jgi:cytoskeletal protein CcmA (bactofilin family)
MNDDKNNEAQESLDSSLELTPQPDSEQNNSQPPIINSPQLNNPKHSLKQFINKFTQKSSIYLPIFIILIIIVAIVTVIDYTNSNKPQPTVAEQTLSPQALNRLANSNQSVGNANQVLTVQSSSIFNGQVLMRSNLQVAGKLQVGGSLNLTGVSISGNSVFNQVQVNKNLSIGGNSSIQGALTVQNSLSVNGGGTFAGTLSAPQITVGSLQLNGNLTLTHNFYASGSIPSQSTNGPVGAGGTTSLNGSDTAGTITINTGNGPTAGCYINVNFVTPFTNTPHILVTPVGSTSANLLYYVNRSTSTFSLCSNNSPQAGTTYSFDYFVIGS